MTRARSERQQYKAFRDQVLEGASEDHPLDTPKKRAGAAAVHLRTVAELEQGNLHRLQGLTEKAELAARHAEDAVKAQEAVVTQARKEADWAAEIVKDLDAADAGKPGEDVQITPQPAEGTG